jgi:hypothetical protein
MIKNYRVLLAFALAVLFLGSAVATVDAQGQPGAPNGPGTGMQAPNRGDDGSIWINTDILTIMASGAMPMFHYWFASDENGSYAKFLAQYVSLIEFEDLNADGAYQSDEVLYQAPLAAYEWTVQTGSITNGDGAVTEVWLKYIKGGASSPMHMVTSSAMDSNSTSSIDRFEDVTLQIWAHIYLEDYTGTVSDGNGVHMNYTVAGSSELKMDIEIGNFPFTSNSTSVAIKTLIKEDVTGSQAQDRFRYRTRERLGNMTGSSNNNWATPGGNESLFQTMNGSCVQNIDFVDSTTDTALGFFNWVDTATITWPGGAQEAVNVTVSYVPTGVGLAVYLAYPHFDGGSLLHDPSIGVYEGADPITPIDTNLVLILGIGIVAVVALAAIMAKKR